MLGEGKVNSLDTHLEQFKLNDQKNQSELQVILKEYSQLLEDYKSLRKAYEEKGTQNGITVTSEDSRSPYVLFLIDGNGYVFNDELVQGKEEGGMKAARMLNDAVEKFLRDANITVPRVLVRLYADVTGLSKSLGKAKLVGLEKRSLGAFTAGFTRAISYFDFVDALNEEGTKFKIREMFQLAAEDSSCSHILYAACHDTSYLSQLVPFSGSRDKITLVQGAGFNPEFHQFSLNVTQFPTIFRWSELSSATPTKPAVLNASERVAFPHKPLKTPVQPKRDYIADWKAPAEPKRDYSSDWRAYGADEGLGPTETNGWGAKAETPKQASQIPCRYYQKGFCKSGAKCNFQHLNKPTPNHHPTTNGLDRSKISSSLPETDIPGYIPLNKEGQRIDTYIAPPTAAEWMIYNTRFRRQKPCNTYQLQSRCTSINCAFDHSPLEPEAHHTLKYVLRCSPCPRKGACRARDCFYGHLCQKDDCVGNLRGCRMKADLHNVDPHLGSMVPAIDEEDIVLDGASEPQLDEAWY